MTSHARSGWNLARSAASWRRRGGRAARKPLTAAAAAAQEAAPPAPPSWTKGLGAAAAAAPGGRELRYQAAPAAPRDSGGRDESFARRLSPGSAVLHHVTSRQAEELAGLRALAPLRGWLGLGTGF